MKQEKELMNTTQKRVLNGVECEVRDYTPHTIGVFFPNHGSCRIRFGLHHIRGNARPYFSVTVSARDFGGCMHDEVLKAVPELHDLVALHMSDLTGAPTYAAQNGFYWLVGALGSMKGVPYHGASGNYGKSPAACLVILAHHLRIGLKEATALVGRINKVAKAEGADAARKAFAAEVDTMRPRWQKEADAAIARWELGIYGDGGRCTPAELAARIAARP